MRQRQQNNVDGVDPLGQELTEGTPVYDRSGGKIGSVDGYDAQANILAVRKGLLFPHDLYAPLSAIVRSNADGVYLNLTEDDLKSEGYAVASQAMTSEIAPLTTSQTVQRTPTDTAPYAADPAYSAPAVDTPPTAQQPPTSSAPVDATRMMSDATGEIALPLAEEQLVPQVETVPLGDVHLHKGVRMVEREVTVPVSHDEVVVEHIAPDQFDASQPAVSGEIIIPILEEQVITQTVTVVKEYLRVRTKRVVEQQAIRAQTRQEYLDTGDDQRYVETRAAGETGEGGMAPQMRGGGAPQAPRRPAAPPAIPPGADNAPERPTRARHR